MKPIRALLTIMLLAPLAVVHSTELTFTIDGSSKGRAFEGIGALSAGASSRLLIDYPEPQRSDILDYLFKPMFGANIQHLKFEIGGDVNSTDGSEPSHAATREEFLNPRPEYFQRGYGWWLMKEAKKRNPAILLEGLQWGAPGWIGDGQFFSQDNADFIAAFLLGAKKYHDLTINYVGICNERDYDTAYIKRLRQTLDRAGLKHVGIVAGDQWQVEKKWKIAEDLSADPELLAAVTAVNAHTTEQVGHRTPEYLTPRRPGPTDPEVGVWNGEGHAYGGDWFAALDHARFNRAYPMGKITKVITWSLITAYPDYLPVPNSGPMKANTPWSGYYEVQPPIWAMAHFNQFAKLGWHYVTTGCAILREGKGHREAGSVTTLKDPTTGEYSMIIETADMREPLHLDLRLSGPWIDKHLAVWRTTFKQDAFIRLDDIDTSHKKFAITLLPGSIYSLTTTRGQSKGRPGHPIPENNPFPTQYSNNFEDSRLGGSPRFFLDQHGTFEVRRREDDRGQCLSQTIPRQGIVWRKCKFPQTVIGDIAWKDCRLSCDFSLPEKGKVRFWIRLNKLDTMGEESSSGYGLEFDEVGKWRLFARNETLASGQVSLVGTEWHRVTLSAIDDQIEARLGGRVLAKISDSRFLSGVAGLGTDWNKASFDNFDVEVFDARDSANGAAAADNKLSHEAVPEAPL
jgi:hypothetical protein